jgi:hypothetical protein
MAVKKWEQIPLFDLGTPPGCCQVVWSTAVLGCGKASHGEVGQGAMVCSVT